LKRNERHIILAKFVGHNIDKEVCVKVAFWLVLMVSLPVLYLTGNIRCAVAKMGVPGRWFVLYFVIGIALLLLPSVFMFGVQISLSGAFLSIAPCVYLAKKKQYGYQIIISAMVAAVIYIAAYVLQSMLAVTYLTAGAIVLLSVLALVVFKEKAGLFLPVLVLVYCVCEIAFALVVPGQYFSPFAVGMDIVPAGITLCLIVSYAYARPRGRHAAKPSQKLKNQTF